MIEVRNLTKRYGTHTVVSHLSFTIEKGKIYGFLGPNGAGKSTTMNMITGCLPMTEGEVKINGHDIFTDPIAAKRSIGYLPEIPPLYPDMTPAEYLRFVAEAKGVEKGSIEDEVGKVMAVTHITGMKNRLIRNLSKGYRQRVGIAQAMLGNPELIILDEPTVGLDPRQIIEIRDLISELGESRTIILSSHILAEISAVCDHVMILSHGHLVASDTLENIRKQYNDDNVLTLTVRGDSAKAEAILKGIRGVSGYELTKLPEEGQFRLTVTVGKDRDIREELFYAFAAAKLPLLGMSSSALSLEEVFIRLTSDEYAQEHGLLGEEQEDPDNGPADDADDDDADDDDGGDGDDDAEEDGAEDSDEPDGSDTSDSEDYTPMFGKKRSGAKSKDGEYKPLFGGSGSRDHDDDGEDD